jgi:ribonuclease BN (tRNA processing enzyme)
MKIRVLGAFGSEALGQRPSAFLVNDKILLDGGTVTGVLTVPEQLEIEHALISHAHLDHIAGLVYLTETLGCMEDRPPLSIASLEPVVDALRTAVFNNVIWPDFTKIPHPDRPTVKFRTLVEDAEQRVGDVWVSPIAVTHSVPAAGFIVHDGSTGLIYSGDTGPTDAIWNAARGLSGIRAIILECAFPNRLAELAGIARHMTPELIRREVDKLPPDIPVLIFHVKPPFYEETAEELALISGNRVQLLEQDKTYVF